MNYFYSILVPAFLLLIVSMIFASCSYAPKYAGHGRPVKEHLDDYGKIVGKNYDMKFLTAEDVTDAHKTKPWKLCTYCLSFSSSQRRTLEEGRIFFITLVEQFWNMLQHDPVVLQYAKKAHEDFFKNMKQFPPYADFEQVGYKISFWDKDMNRMQKPYLAQVEFWKGKFRYFYADPETQKLVPAFEESYEDAIAYKNKMQTMPDQKT